MDWLGLRDRFRTLSPGLLLPLILVVALGLRFYGIGWDQGYGFHPDERSFYMRADCMYRVLTEAPGYADCTRDYPEMEPGLPSIGTFFDAARSPLNPHWFSLGSVLIYLLVALRFVLEPFTDLNTLQSMGYLGRSIMALADVGTVFIVYLLGKRIYDRRVGLLAATLVALAVVHIQNSHFYRPEPLLVFFLMASFWAMLQVMERRRLRDSLLLGACVGLTLAAKVSVLPLVLPLLAVYGFSLFTTAGGAWVQAIPGSRSTEWESMPWRRGRWLRRSSSLPHPTPCWTFANLWETSCGRRLTSQGRRERSPSPSSTLAPLRSCTSFSRPQYGDWGYPLVS